MVDAVLVILAVGILAALVAMRFKPGSRRRAAVAGAPVPPRPGGARTGALRTSVAQRSGPWPGGAQRGSPRPGSAQPVSPRPGSAHPVSPRPGSAHPGSPRPAAAPPTSPRPVASPPVNPRPGAAPPVRARVAAALSGGTHRGEAEAGALPPPAAAPETAAHYTAVLARPVPAALEAVTGPQTGSRFALLPGDNRVGRAGGNHIRLTDVAVSSQHAIVRVAGGQVMIFDDASTNGTYVNGEQVLEPRRLADGDQVTLGETTLAVRLGAAPQRDQGAG